jgi:V8-like Glu-specific endopeptidase
MHSNDRPLTEEEVAQLAARAEPEGKDFELDGSSSSCNLTFYGNEDEPEIRLRRILDREGRKTVGWELVSSQPFSYGLNVTDVGRAPLPERDDDLPDELDAFLPGTAVGDAIEVADPHPARPLRRRNHQLVRPEWVFYDPDDDRQVYKPSSKAGSAHSLVGKLQVWLDKNAPGPTYGASAALISKNAILTAAHAIPWFLVANSLPFKALFVPAYYDGKSVFTRADGSTPFAWCTAAWGYPGHDQGDDMGVWKLSAPLGQEWGYFGYKTYSDNWEDMPVWRLNGYPGDIGYGTRPARDFDFPIVDDDDDGAGVELEYFADTSGGMSGGPVWGWFDKNGVPKPYIIGTHVGGEDNFLEEKHNLAAGGPALSALIKWARDNW